MKCSSLLSSLAFMSLLSLGLHADGSVADSSQKNSSCGDAPRPMRVVVRHIEGQGVGYNQGYTTLEGFFAPLRPWNETWLPFLDVRGHLFNNGQPAANVGVGVRYLGISRIWGGNAYYDYRGTTRQQYNQISMGLESLGEIWDFRLNGYLPVGRTKSSFFETHFDSFHGHHMILSRRRAVAMRGINAEVGAHVDTFRQAPLYFAAGPYYLEGPGKAAWGGELRAAVDLWDYVRLEVSTSYDNVFKWIGQGQVSLVLSFGGKRPIKPREGASCSTALSRRAFQRVDRNEIIPVRKQHKKTVAIDPATGQPLFFVFVNNTSSSAGTFESPFPTLVAAQNASGVRDIIYVFPGNGTTTGMAAGITMKANQKFWGSGIPHQVTTSVGTVTVPALTTTNPLVTNTAGNAITLANGVEVSGVQITGALTNGIIGTSVGGVTIANTRIFGSGNHGIFFNETSSVSQILKLASVNVTNNTVDGINVTATNGANITVSIVDSISSTNGSAAGNGITLSSANTSVISGTITNNTLHNNLSSGINCDSTSNATSALTFNIADNLIEGQSQYAITGAFSGTAAANVTMDRNTIQGNTGVGYTNSFVFGGAASTLTARNNEVNYNDSAGFRMQVGSSNFVASLSDNSISRNSSAGILIEPVGTSPINITLTDNTISGNGSKGVRVSSAVLATLNLTLSGNDLSENTAGLDLEGSTFNTVTVTADTNTVNGNSGNAFGLSQTSLHSIFTITNNQMNGNTSGANGIFLVGGDGTTVDQTLVASGNTYSGNAGYGILSAPTATTMTFTVQNETITGGAAGISHAGTFTNQTLLISNNLIQGSAGIGVSVSSDVTTNTISILNNTVSDHLGIGISLTCAPAASGTLSLNVSNNTVIANRDNGIFFSFLGATTQTSTATISSNTVEYNTGRGIYFIGTPSAVGTLNLTISSNTVAFNNGNVFVHPSGVLLFGSTAGAFNFRNTVTGNTINNNNVMGLKMVSSDHAVFSTNATSNTLTQNSPFASSPANSGLQAVNTDATSSTCLRLGGNVSDTGYLLTQTAGTFNLAPGGTAGAQAVNSGTISTVGVIGSVGSCP